MRTQLPARTTRTDLVAKSGTQMEKTTAGSVARPAPSGPTVYVDISEVVANFGGYCHRSWFTERAPWAEFRREADAWGFADWCETHLVVRRPEDMLIGKQNVHPPIARISRWHVELLSAAQQGRSTHPEVESFLDRARPPAQPQAKKGLADLVTKWVALLAQRAKPLLLPPPAKKLPPPSKK